MTHRGCTTPEQCLCCPPRAPGEIDSDCNCLSVGETCDKCGAPTPETCFACGEPAALTEDSIVGACCAGAEGY